MRRVYGNNDDKFTILIHDDEQGIIDGLTPVFKRYNFAVNGTTDTKELLGMISNDQYDILILDYFLSDGMDAEKLVPLIRGIDKQIFIILLTGHDKLFKAEDILDSFEGVQNYCEKSDKFATLVLQVLAARKVIKHYRTDLSNTVGEKIRQIREAAGETQEVFAKKVGVSRQMLIKYENNKVVSPDINILINIARIYNISMDWLLGLKVT